LQASSGFFEINGLAQIHFRQFVEFRGFSALFSLVLPGHGESDVMPLWLRSRAPNPSQKNRRIVG